MNSILQVFYSIFSGLFLSLAIPNEIFLFGSPLIAFFSIALYYYALKYSKSYKQAFLLGFLQTLTTHLCSSFWLAYFKDFAIFTLGASALGTAILGGFFGLFFYLPNSLSNNSKINILKFKKSFHETPDFRILYFTIIYVIYEWCKSSGFLGYPWGTVSSAMFNWSRFIQIVDITGEYGLTFIAVYFNCFLIEFFEHCWDLQLFASFSKKENHLCNLKSSFICFAFLFISIILYGNFQLAKTRTPRKLLTSVIVQHNADPWIIHSDEERIKTSQQLTRNQLALNSNNEDKPQLIIWSEGTLLYPFPTARIKYKQYPEDDPFIPFVKEIKTPLITGGAVMKNFYYKDEEYNKFYNTALAFDTEGNFRGYYGKLHLVPFAESLPGSNNPIIRNFLMKVIGISSGWTKGEQLMYFDIPCSWYDEKVLPAVDSINLSIPYDTYKEYYKDKPLVRIATPICFDDAFTDVMRPLFNSGAELFVNITDDSWSLTKSSEYQHFVIASYKAIEYRTTLVRATNSGYSVVLDPTGKIICDLPLFTQAATTFKVPIYSHKFTIYSKLGNWLPYLCIALFFLFSIYAKKNFKKTDYIASERKAKKQKKLRK